MNPRRLRRQVLISLAITVLVLGLILLYTWREKSFTALADFQWSYLAFAVCGLILAWIADMIRIHIITRAIGHRIPSAAALRVVLIGHFVSAITPFTAGGGPLQAYALTRSGIPLSKAGAAVLASAIIAQLSLLALAGFVMIILGVHITHAEPVQQLVGWALALYGIGLSCFVYLVWNIHYGLRLWAAIHGWLERRGCLQAPRFEKLLTTVDTFLRELNHSFRQLFQGRPLYALGASAAYMIYFIALFSIAPILMWGLGETVSVWRVITVQIPVYLLISVLPTPGGSGGLELGMAMAFTEFLLPHQVGLVVAGWRLITFYGAVGPGGLAFMFLMQPERIPRIPGVGKRPSKPG